MKKSRIPLYLALLLLPATMAQPTASYSYSEAETISEALQNTLILPLKQIHDALEPLERIRDDLSSIAAGPSTTTQAECGYQLRGSILPTDCGQLYNAGYVESGVYNVYIYSAGQPIPVPVYCDMETDGGGWLVFQRRQDGSVDFYQNWKAYNTGFGNITGEFWLGNELLHLLTDRKAQQMRVDLEDHEGDTAYVKYQQFYVGPQMSHFALNASGYSGTAGDSLSAHNGANFSTKDQDNDSNGSSCAIRFKGAWWYTSCHASNLNGLYGQTGSHNMTSYADHVTWLAWRGYRYSIKLTEMKIRPINF